MARNGDGKAAKSGVKRVNKPRTFYMVYKGTLDGPPHFAWDRDDLIDLMLNDREVKVEKITVPAGQRRKRGGAGAEGSDQPQPTA